MYYFIMIVIPNYAFYVTCVTTYLWAKWPRFDPEWCADFKIKIFRLVLNSTQPTLY